MQPRIPSVDAPARASRRANSAPTAAVRIAVNQRASINAIIWPLWNLQPAKPSGGIQQTIELNHSPRSRWKKVIGGLTTRPAAHHLGALWIDVEPFSRDGLIALTCVSGISRVAPHGGNEAFYGINPLAFAVPRANAEPLIFNLASAAMAWGEIRLAAQERRPVPPGTGLDRNHQPTTDHAAILDGGVILTFGAHKGSSISMMVELLAAALTGGDFSFEVDRSAHPGAESSRSGQFVLLIDPRKSAGRPYVERVEALIVGLRAAGRTRLPGDRRRVHRMASTGGVQLTPANRRILQQLGTSGANPL